MKLPTVNLSAGAVLALAGAAVGLYVLWSAKGAAGRAVDSIGSAVGAIGDTVGGALGGVHDFMVAPLPQDSRGWLEMGQGDEVTSDAAIARWLIDNVGYWDASKWATAGALWSAQWLPVGSGRRPARGSAVGAAFAHVADRGQAPAAASPAPILANGSFSDWAALDPYKVWNP